MQANNYSDLRVFVQANKLYAHSDLESICAGWHTEFVSTKLTDVVFAGFKLLTLAGYLRL